MRLKFWNARFSYHDSSPLLSNIYQRWDTVAHVNLVGLIFPTCFTLFYIFNYNKYNNNFLFGLLVQYQKHQGKRKHLTLKLYF